MESSLEKIYESQNSTVYKKSEKGGYVTIKVLKPDLTNSRQILQFNNEFSILSELNIPGIRHVIAKTTFEGSPAFVSKYFDGITLKKYIKEAEFDLTKRLVIASQIAFILGQIHNRNIIHRDLTADNILVNPDSLEVLITDFGQSLKLDVKTTHLLNPDRLEGSIAYFSPEQTGRMNRVVDYRSDLYSLGIILFELFTGNLPFTELDPLKLIHAHLVLLPSTPKEINPQIPDTLSRIIEILLSKNAEERYQSAFGLESDLRKCISILAEGGEPVFDLSHDKIFTKFQVPQKLYGREREIEFLMNTFEQVSNGKGQILLVSGYSGVGKTALVNEIHKPITSRNGYFIKGKFDQYNRNIPYNAFTQALNDYCHILMAESDETLNTIRQQIIDMVGQQGKILTDIIPDLELVIGPQPPVAKLDLVENKILVNRLLLNFFKTISSIEHPMVIFLDDLQWADVASMGLISMLANEQANLVVLLIGAYRDNEVDQQHSLSLMIQELQKAGTQLMDLKINALLYPEVKSMLEETIHYEDKEGVSKLIYEKTKGNAFFTIQFIRDLLDEKFVRYDETSKTWIFDLEAIQSQSYTDNVIDLMIRKIKNLEPSTQRKLIVASIFGNTFQLANLSIILNDSPNDVLEDLWPALTEGYIHPINDAYRMFTITELNVLPESVLFTFAHDRIQQASYQLIDQSERTSLHLAIGRMLSRKYGIEDEILFDLVNHYNLALGLVSDSAELTKICEVNLRAGLKAKLSNAISASVRYLEQARSLLPADAWETNYEKAFLINRELAEAYYLDGKPEHSDEILSVCIEKTKTPAERAEIYYIYTLRLNLVSNYDKALDEAVNGLNELGYSFPKKTEWPEIQKHLDEINTYVAEHPIETLSNLPKISDPVSISIMKLMDNLSSTLYLGGKTELWMLHVMHKVLITIRKGISLQSSYAFAELGLIYSMLGAYKPGLESGNLAMLLAERHSSEAPRIKGSTGNIAVNYVFPYCRSVRETSILNIQAYKDNLESGELIFGGYTLLHSYYNDFFTSDKIIENIQADLPTGIAYSLRINHFLCLHALYTLEMCAHYLSHSELAGGEIQSHRFTISSLIAHCDAQNESYGPATATAYGMFVNMIFNTTQASKELDAIAPKYLPVIVASPTHFSTYMFSHCWTHLQLKINDPGYELPVTVGEYMIKLDSLQQNCEENFGDMYYFLKSLQATLDNNHDETFHNLTMAAKLANKARHLHLEGIIQESLGKHWLSRDQRSYAEFHLRQSLVSFTQWGATSKADQLRKSYKDILDTSGVVSSATLISNTNSVLAEKLDLFSILNLSQKIGAVFTMKDVKATILQTVMEQAGASRAALILLSGKESTLVASHEVGEPEMEEERALSDAVLDLPVSMIQFVIRKKEPLLVNDMAVNKVFHRDPYFYNTLPESIWVLPLMVKNDANAILYLENKLVKDAFTQSRIQIIQMLSYQLGISIDNARLYDDLKTINTIYEKFVPVSFLQTLGHNSIVNVKLGDQIQREMTILFTDIRSYTTISESLSPQENFEFINEYLSYAAPSIEQNNGFVNQFTGDGIMALFTGAEDGLQSALRLQLEIRKYNETRSAKGLPPIKVGTGLHTGNLMLGVIGDGQRHDTGVISNEVTTASRIEGLTKMFDASILLSETTLRKITNATDYHFRFLGSVQVKGKTSAVRVFECFSGELQSEIDLKLKTLEDFNAGLKAYFNKDFIEAASHLKKVMIVNPTDVTAERYFRHAADLMVKGVGADWTGIEIMTEK